MNSDFTEQEIREFEDQWQVPVLRIANVTGQRTADGRGLDGRSGITVSQISVYNLSSKFEFSFVAPIHFLQKLWGEVDEIILCDHVRNSS